MFGIVETKLSEAGATGVSAEMLTWPDSHSKLASTASFRRFFIIIIITVILI